MSFPFNTVYQAFDKAAQSYEAHADIQREIAQSFANKLISLKDKPQNILEIGCGTGFLTEPLLTAYPTSSFHATDLSPSMLDVLKKKLSMYMNLKTSILDANKPNLKDNYDWIVSSLAFQWLINIENTLNSLAKKTRLLAFTTLIDGTFSQWHALCTQNNWPIKTLPFITKKELRYVMSQQSHDFEITIKEYKKSYNKPIDFIRDLKSIGAHTPNLSNSESIQKKGSSKWLTQKNPFAVSYNVAFCQINF